MLLAGLLGLPIEEVVPVLLPRGPLVGSVYQLSPRGSGSFQGIGGYRYLGTYIAGSRGVTEVINI